MNKDELRKLALAAKEAQDQWVTTGDMKRGGDYTDMMEKSQLLDSTLTPEVVLELLDEIDSNEAQQMELEFRSKKK